MRKPRENIRTLADLLPNLTCVDLTGSPIYGGGALIVRSSADEGHSALIERFTWHELCIVNIAGGLSHAPGAPCNHVVQFLDSIPSGSVSLVHFNYPFLWGYGSLKEFKRLSAVDKYKLAESSVLGASIRKIARDIPVATPD